MNKTDAPIQVYRNGLLESKHQVHIAVVDAAGKLLYSYGDPSRISFPRSALKPFQAIPLIESGAADRFGFSDADIAICCASHSGEARHRTRVLNMLARIDADESFLRCGPHIPRDQEGYKQWIREGKELTPVFNNCSGKHTGMIATCIHLNEAVKNYYELDHPLQEQIIEQLKQICGIDNDQFSSGEDGCGLPAHRFPLYHMAVGFARLARPDLMVNQEHAVALKRIRDCMIAHPEMVGGSQRFDTDIMDALHEQVVTKMGAEGIQGIGLLESGLGIAIKVEDGNNRAASVAAMHVLEQLDLVRSDQYEQLKFHSEPLIKNTVGENVGQITADFKLDMIAER